MPPAVDPSGLDAWTEAVSVVLSARFGPWAYYWHWAPELRHSWNWINRFPSPADAPVLAAELLLTWRRWLEGLAERFDRLRPLLDRAAAAGPADLVAGWEAAIAELVRAAAAPVADDDRWAGACRRALPWFLTATGVLDLAGNAPAVIPGNWPDTWPQDWPVWRSTNTTGHD